MTPYLPFQCEMYFDISSFLLLLFIACFWSPGQDPLSGHNLQFKDTSSVVLFITKIGIFFPTNTESFH